MDREFYLTTNILRGMSIKIDGESLTINNLVKVAREKAAVSIPDSSWEKINLCRNMLEEKIKKHEIMYGITTGIGEFSEVVLDELAN